MNIKYRKLSISRNFGIELELSNSFSKKKIKEIIESHSKRLVKVTRYQLSYKNDFWHIKNDSSCGPAGPGGPAGVEIATYVCSGLADLNHVVKVIGEVRKAGAVVNEHCGLHIHVDACDLSEAEVCRIVLHWLRIEPVLRYAMPLRRRDNKYCKLMGPTIPGDSILKYAYDIAGYNSVIKFFKPIDSQGQFFDHTYKRKTLNLLNYFESLRTGRQVRKTLEFRWPEGTLQSEDIKGWVCLFLSFIEKSKNRRFVFDRKTCKSDLLEVLDVVGLGQNRVFSIFDENLSVTRKWLLDRFVANSDESMWSQKNIKNEAQALLNRMYGY